MCYKLGSLFFALLPWFPIILASPGVILGLPRVASPVLDVYVTAHRQVVQDPFFLFASHTTLFPHGETAVINTTSQIGDSRPNLPNTLAKT